MGMRRYMEWGEGGVFNERAAGEQLKKRNVIKISNVFLVLDVSVVF